MQSKKPNSVPMLLKAKSKTHHKQLPSIPWKRNDCRHTGTAAFYAASRMLCIRENEKKRREGENLFSPSRRFLVLSVPVENLQRFSHYTVPHAPCAKAFGHPDYAIACGCPEEELLWRRVQGLRKPLLSLVLQASCAH